MNKRFLCIFGSLLFSTNLSFAMEKPINNLCSYIEETANLNNLIDFNNPLFTGGAGNAKVYKNKCDANKLIKLVFSKNSNEINSEINIARKLIGKKHSNHLMHVTKIYGNNSYEFEKIDGIDLTDYIVSKKEHSISWDCFCRNWVLGLFKGMKDFQYLAGEHYFNNDPHFAVLSDRSPCNILVYKSKQDEDIPVHIDFGLVSFISKNPKAEYHGTFEFRRIAILLYDMLNKNIVDVPENKEDCKNKLKKYFTEIPTTINENTLSEIILKLASIIEDKK